MNDIKATNVLKQNIVKSDISVQKQFNLINLQNYFNKFKKKSQQNKITIKDIVDFCYFIKKSNKQIVSKQLKDNCKQFYNNILVLEKNQIIFFIEQMSRILVSFTKDEKYAHKKYQVQKSLENSNFQKIFYKDFHKLSLLGLKNSEYLQQLYLPKKIFPQYQKNYITIEILTSLIQQERKKQQLSLNYITGLIDLKNLLKFISNCTFSQMEQQKLSLVLQKVQLKKQNKQQKTFQQNNIQSLLIFFLKNYFILKAFIKQLRQIFMKKNINKDIYFFQQQKKFLFKFVSSCKKIQLKLFSQQIFFFYKNSLNVILKQFQSLILNKRQIELYQYQVLFAIQKNFSLNEMSNQLHKFINKNNQCNAKLKLANIKLQFLQSSNEIEHSLKIIWEQMLISKQLKLNFRAIYLENFWNILRVIRNMLTKIRKKISIEDLKQLLMLLSRMDLPECSLKKKIIETGKRIQKIFFRVNKVMDCFYWENNDLSVYSKLQKVQFKEVEQLLEICQQENLVELKPQAIQMQIIINQYTQNVKKIKRLCKDTNDEAIKINKKQIVQCLQKLLINPINFQEFDLIIKIIKYSKFNVFSDGKRFDPNFKQNQIQKKVFSILSAEKKTIFYDQVVEVKLQIQKNFSIQKKQKQYMLQEMNKITLILDQIFNDFVILIMTYKQKNKKYKLTELQKLIKVLDKYQKSILLDKDLQMLKFDMKFVKKSLIIAQKNKKQAQSYLLTAPMNNGHVWKQLINQL